MSEILSLSSSFKSLNKHKEERNVKKGIMFMLLYLTTFAFSNMLTKLNIQISHGTGAEIIFFMQLFCSPAFYFILKTFK